MKRQDCKSFERCGTPLCPLDPDLKDRVWYDDEPICQSNGLCKRRWIRKQRQIVRRKIKKYMGRPLTYQELFDASRPRKLSDVQREVLKRNAIKKKSDFLAIVSTERTSPIPRQGVGAVDAKTQRQCQFYHGGGCWPRIKTPTTHKAPNIKATF